MPEYASASLFSGAGSGTISLSQMTDPRISILSKATNESDLLFNSNGFDSSLMVHHDLSKPNSSKLSLSDAYCVPNVINTTMNPNPWLLYNSHLQYLGSQFRDGDKLYYLTNDLQNNKFLSSQFNQHQPQNQPSNNLYPTNENHHQALLSYLVPPDIDEDESNCKLLVDQGHTNNQSNCKLMDVRRKRDHIS